MYLKITWESCQNPDSSSLGTSGTHDSECLINDADVGFPPFLDEENKAQR